MPDRVVSSSKLTAIANAIRTKAGTQSSMTLDEMPTAIANIPGGGSTIDLTGSDGQNWCASLADRLDTSGMTDMNSMFYYQRTATSIDVSHFNTSNVTNMNYMFYYCRQLTSLNLVSFNTSQVTKMEGMFSGCQRLTTINNLSNLNTSNVTTMYGMFNSLASQAANPVSLDLSTFRTSNVTNMMQMFSGANLISLDLDNWNTSNVTTMYNMFNNAFKNGTAMWVPSTFVATSVSNDIYKPFYADPGSQVHVYTDATDATTQGWGTIHSNYIMHYNTTHQDFLNLHKVTIIITDSIEHSGGALVQMGTMTSVTLSPKATYRINPKSGTYPGITITADGNNYIISGTPTQNASISFTTTQNTDILTSTQKNFANWTRSSTYNNGFIRRNDAGSSLMSWQISPVQGYKNEGYYYRIDNTQFPANVPFQFTLAYKVDPKESGYNSDGCFIGISTSATSGKISSHMLGSISISNTQTETYLTQTFNVTRTSDYCYLVVSNSNYTKNSGTAYRGKIRIALMTLREV